MEKIQEWFLNNIESYEITPYDSKMGDAFEAKNSNVIYRIIKPHAGTKNRWLLQVTTKSAFDRWANSTAFEKFFETDDALCNYLNAHQLDIYKHLLDYLSKEYNELEDESIW